MRVSPQTEGSAPRSRSKLYDKLNLNPSRLINLNKNVNNVFSFDDFKQIDKIKYPLSADAFKKGIEDEDFEYFINILFDELKNKKDI